MDKSKDPVIILGYRGSMGRRYAAILEYLGHPWFGIEEMNQHYCGVKKMHMSDLPVRSYHSIINCTPTMMHLYTMKKYNKLNLPILCEKPISLKMDDVRFIIEQNWNVSMVNQYKYLVDENDSGETYYNYYNSGRDGIEWDCLNIIGLAKEKPKISNGSPYWHCMINGKKLTLEQVNRAYVAMIKDWLEIQRPDFDYIMKAHGRASEGFFEYVEDNLWNPSEIDQPKVARESVHENRQSVDSAEDNRRSDEVSRIHRRPKRDKDKNSSSLPGN